MQEFECHDSLMISKGFGIYMSPATGTGRLVARNKRRWAKAAVRKFTADVIECRVLCSASSEKSKKVHHCCGRELTISATLAAF
jgi:hypothetical protein